MDMISRCARRVLHVIYSLQNTHNLLMYLSNAVVFSSFFAFFISLIFCIYLCLRAERKSDVAAATVHSAGSDAGRTRSLSCSLPLGWQFLNDV